MQTRRNLNDWEIYDYQQLIHIVSQTNLGNQADFKQWIPEKKRVYSLLNLSIVIYLLAWGILVMFFLISKYGRLKFLQGWRSLHEKLVKEVY